MKKLLLAGLIALLGAHAAFGQGSNAPKTHQWTPWFYEYDDIGKRLYAGAEDPTAYAQMVTQLVDIGIAIAGSELSTNALYNMFADKDRKLPKLAMGPTGAAVYLELDDGSWCIIPNARMLAFLEDDKLEPAVRSDIPASVTKVCRWPNGFYIYSGNPTVYYLGSGNTPTDKWYGIAQGSFYCGVPTVQVWHDLLRRLGARGDAQANLNRVEYADSVGDGRIDAGICTSDTPL